MITSPLSYILFPYTTLFRSIVNLLTDPMILLMIILFLGSWLGKIEIHGISLGVSGVLFIGMIFGDRKSTRLNSSHVAISYAVFCLKKKKHYAELISALATLE